MKGGLYIRKKHIIISITALMFTVVSVAVFVPMLVSTGEHSFAQTASVSDGRDSQKSQDKYLNDALWAQYIDEVGAEEAYTLLGKVGRDFSTGIQHEMAHAFGGALYEKKELEGFPVCDSRFLYGCFHEFVGRAIADKGQSVTHMLNQTCLGLGDEAGFCQHGIGHGVVALSGYDDNALERALNTCQKLAKNDPIGGCNGGVFMEYNLRTMLGTDAEVRVSDDPLHPCSTFSSGEFANACAFWAPQWWRNGPLNGFGTDEEVYAKMGEFCNALNGDAVIRHCYRGIGNIISPGTEFNISRVRTLCDATSQNARKQTYCRVGAVNRSDGLLNQRELVRMCDGLKNSYREYCIAVAEKDLERLRNISL